MFFEAFKLSIFQNRLFQIVEKAFFCLKPVFFVAQLVTLAVMLSSCAGTPPLKEYTLAREALSHAEKAGAMNYAKSFYIESKAAYKKAVINFDQRYYDQAKKRFIIARRYAEKAENLARIKKFQDGEGAP